MPGVQCCDEVRRGGDGGTGLEQARPPPPRPGGGPAARMVARLLRARRPDQVLPQAVRPQVPGPQPPPRRQPPAGLHDLRRGPGLDVSIIFRAENEPSAKFSFTGLLFHESAFTFKTLLRHYATGSP